MDFSFELTWEFCRKNGGDFGEFFLVSVFLNKTARKLPKKVGENSEQNSGQNSGRKSEKIVLRSRAVSIHRSALGPGPESAPQSAFSGVFGHQIAAHECPKEYFLAFS